MCVIAFDICLFDIMHNVMFHLLYVASMFAIFHVVCSSVSQGSPVQISLQIHHSKCIKVSKFVFNVQAIRAKIENSNL